MKILVVEDDPLIVRTLGELLEAEGYEVATTARQDEATALLAQSSFDLLLTRHHPCAGKRFCRLRGGTPGAS